GCAAPAVAPCSTPTRRSMSPPEQPPTSGRSAPLGSAPLPRPDRSFTVSSSTHVLVIGAGASGSAAVRELAQQENVTTTAIIDAEVAPYNRTLVNKAVATGLIEADQAQLPPLPGSVVRDSVRAVDP